MRQRCLSSAVASKTLDLELVSKKAARKGGFLFVRLNGRRTRGLDIHLGVNDPTIGTEDPLSVEHNPAVFFMGAGPGARGR